MSLYKKILFVLVIAGLLLAGIAGLRGGMQTSVQGAHPVRGPAVEAVYATGIVEPVLQAKMAPLTAVRIVRILKRDGDAVQPGDVLVRLDHREAEANLEQLMARRDYLRDDLGRQQVLVDKGFVSTASLSKLRFDLKQAEASLEAARRPLAETVLRSPLKGVVLRQDGEEGEMVAAGQTLFWVGAPRPMRVTADVDEEDILRVKPGQKALLKADGLPGQLLTARVAEITEKGDSLNKNYRVRLTLPEETPLKTGMTVEVNIVTVERPDALLVPTSSLRGEQAWIVDQKNGQSVARRVPVRTGIRGQEQTEILAGVDAGQTLIVAPPQALSDGQVVRVR